MKYMVIQKQNGILIVKVDGDNPPCESFIRFEDMEFEEIKIDYSLPILGQIL